MSWWSGVPFFMREEEGSRRTIAGFGLVVDGAEGSLFPRIVGGV
jgi:hypothetical protein